MLKELVVSRAKSFMGLINLGTYSISADKRYVLYGFSSSKEKKEDYLNKVMKRGPLILN